MIRQATMGITTGPRHLAGSAGSRLFLAAVLLLGVGLALVGAIGFVPPSPFWANRIWSDAQAVKAVMAQQLNNGRDHAIRPADAVPTSADDYVEGLARRGIASIPGFHASRTGVE